MKQCLKHFKPAMKYLLLEIPSRTVKIKTNSDNNKGLVKIQMNWTTHLTAGGNAECYGHSGNQSGSFL